MDKVTFPGGKGTKFALLGSGKTMCDFIRLLDEQDFPAPVIVTHPETEHRRDRELLGSYSDIYEDVIVQARRTKLELIETRQVNESSLLDTLNGFGCSAAFSFSCRSIIKQPFIKHFSGRVFNSHGTDLPCDRGAGGCSWRIMRNERYAYGVIHVVDVGIDTGPVVLKQRRELGVVCPYPLDIFRATVELSAIVLDEFLQQVANGSVSVIPQPEAGGSYFPRLLTEEQGIIDWSWQSSDIDRFIRAFAPPYPGAWTMLGEQRIALLDCQPLAETTVGHPFMSGLVIRCRADGAVVIAAPDNPLRIENIKIDGMTSTAADILKPGMRLHSPKDLLEKAKNYKYRC